MTEFKIIHDVITNEIMEVPLTDKELKELEKVRANAAKENQAAEAAKAKVEAEKTALLARLGITEDEAKLLFG